MSPEWLSSDRAATETSAAGVMLVLANLERADIEDRERAWE